MAAPFSLLIVGGGCSGALLASLLPPALQATTQLWEKSTSAGRFATSTARGAAAGARADGGAQYCTAFDAPSAAALEAAAAAGALRRLPPGAILGEREPTASLPSYYAPAGARSLVEHYLRAAAGGGVALHKSRRLVALEAGVPGAAGAAGAAAGAAAAAAASAAPAATPAAEPPAAPQPQLQWLATDEAGGEAWFSAVVLTLPVPQLLELRGGALAGALAASGLRAALASVAYSSRFALTLHLARGSLGSLAERLPWHARYVAPAQQGGDVLRYLAFEDRKRWGEGGGGGASGGGGGGGEGGEGAPCPTFTAHSSVELGAAHEKATPERWTTRRAWQWATAGQTCTARSRCGPSGTG